MKRPCDAADGGRKPKYHSRAHAEKLVAMLRRSVPPGDAVRLHAYECPD